MQGSGGRTKAIPMGNIYTDFGQAQQIGGGSWNIQSQTDAPGSRGNDTETYNIARDVWQSTLRDLQDPSGQARNAEQMFRNAMIPMYEEQKRLNMGAATAGLGNKYSSTYGQLIMDEQARKEAIARAQLEQEAFLSGQDQIDRLFGRSAQAGGMTDLAQQVRLRPYELLTGMVTGIGGMTAQQNNALAALQQANGARRGGGLGNIGQGLMSLASLS